MKDYFLNEANEKAKEKAVSHFRSTKTLGEGEARYCNSIIISGHTLAPSYTKPACFQLYFCGMLIIRRANYCYLTNDDNDSVINYFATFQSAHPYFYYTQFFEPNHLHFMDRNIQEEAAALCYSQS